MYNYGNLIINGIWKKYHFVRWSFLSLLFLLPIMIFVTLDSISFFNTHYFSSNRFSILIRFIGSMLGILALLETKMGFFPDAIYEKGICQVPSIVEIIRKKRYIDFSMISKCEFEKDEKDEIIMCYFHNKTWKDSRCFRRSSYANDFFEVLKLTLKNQQLLK